MSGARAVAPVLHEPVAPRLPAVAHYRLTNGLEVLLVEHHGLPVVNAQLVVRAGAYSDDAAHAGRAALMAEVMDQGTLKRSATQIADQAERLGASLHTRAGWDFCTVALHVLAPRLEPALELVADVARNPTFPEEETSRKRAERHAAILQESAEPRILATNAFLDVVYGPTHPYGRPLGGTAGTVAALERAGLEEFHRRRFGPAAAFLTVVGDVSPESAIPLLERLFGSWAAPTSAIGPDHENLPRGAPAIHIVDRPGAPQSEVRVGLAGPPRDTRDYFPLLVANTVLGGAFTSRLNMLLREEKAYTYGAGTSLALRAGGGPFLASTAVHTAATADTIDTIVRQVRRLAEEPVGDAELERAKNYIVLGLPRTFETTADIAEHVSEVALHGLGDHYYDRYAECVRAVSAADVQAAAAHWLRADALHTVVAGDASAVRHELESLQIGVVHVREGS